MSRCLSIVLRFIALCATGLPIAATAQLYQAPSDLRGSGQVQTCDTSMHVSFNTTYLNNWGCLFDAQIDAGSNTVVQNTVWNYYNGSWVNYYADPLMYYPGQEPYPICLTVNAYDLIAAQPCSTTVCELITPLPEPICATLIPDFTIANIEGNTITFQDQSTFDGMIGTAYWSFGDGTAMTSGTNMNSFAGSGPYEVCLTVVGAPPSECVSTVCKWLYLGSGNVDCPILVEQGFQMLTYENMVGVWDTSRTSGMYSRVDWDFGDGAEATGTIAVHGYAQPGQYEVCGTLSVWGPLLADTCTSTICRQAGSPVGVEEIAGQGGWIFPSPFASTITITGNPGPRMELRILDQVGRVVHTSSPRRADGTSTVDLSDLPPGVYLAELRDASGVRATRIVKQ